MGRGRRKRSRGGAEERRKGWGRWAGRNRFSIGATAFAGCGTISSRGSTLSGQGQQPMRRPGERAIRPIAGLIAKLRRAARVFLAHWRVGFDRALRYMGGVRA